MNRVIAAIDQAELVIADLTTYNPNVFYELALAHALGVATLAVREKPGVDESRQVPFDLGAYRYYDITLDKPAVAVQLLLPALKEIVEQIDRREVFDSPIKSYYKEPITNISAAAGIAQGYFHHFIRPVVQSLSEVGPDGALHLHDIACLPRSVKERRLSRLEIIVPTRLEYTRQHRVQELRRSFEEVEIPASRRQLKALARLDTRTGVYHLLDLPTTMNIMEYAIEKRLDTLYPDPNTSAWHEIETREIDRFQFELEQWVAYQDRRNQEYSIQERIVIYRYDPEKDDPNLDWLYPIWR
jgi:hypothetical protein